MKVARYVGSGEVEIMEEERPECPQGGLLVRTEACGLCSGELMSWYMDSKIPHVLGHEVSGIVEESDTVAFSPGTRIFPHHHAPCGKCRFCRSGREVHCEQWKRTRLEPGGMADFFAVGPDNLPDTHQVNDLMPVDAALTEPLACVCKSLRVAGPLNGPAAVIGLGGMGLLHMFLLPQDSMGYDLDRGRVAYARSEGLRADLPLQAEPAATIFVCPGSQAAFDQAMAIVEPGGTIVMFAPLGPGQQLKLPQSAYFKDLRVLHSYSCGPSDTAQALVHLRKGTVRAEQICSHFIELSELPKYYKLMQSGKIIKPMVVWA